MQVVDLFSGCGGMSLGFMQAGFDVIAAFDHWDAVQIIYEANFDHDFYRVDLSQGTPDILKMLSPDIIIGGPPCQDFSSAGKRDETLGRADLTITFAQIVVDIRPQWLVMENVERIRNSAVLRQAKAILKASDYGISEYVLDASLCGVPQKRKRYFLIGELNGLDHSLEPYLEEGLAAKPMSVYDYLENSLGVEYYYRHPRSYQRRGIFSIYEPSPTVRGVNRPIPKTYQVHPNDACHDLSCVRPLTTYERSLLQTFPTDFTWIGSKSKCEQMIGNAVPVKLALYVAKALQGYINGSKSSISQKMPQQLKLF